MTADEYDLALSIALDHGRGAFRWGLAAGLLAGFVVGAVTVWLLR